MDLGLGLPSVKFLGKVALALVIIVLVVNMLPDTWGLKKWFKVS